MFQFKYHLTYEEASNISPLHTFTRVIEIFDDPVEALEKKHEWRRAALKAKFRYKKLTIRKVVV